MNIVKRTWMVKN